MLHAISVEQCTACNIGISVIGELARSCGGSSSSFGRHTKTDEPVCKLQVCVLNYNKDGSLLQPVLPGSRALFVQFQKFF